jgi:hypothetical protein
MLQRVRTMHLERLFVFRKKLEVFPNLGDIVGADGRDRSATGSIIVRDRAEDVSPILSR